MHLYMIVPELICVADYTAKIGYRCFIDLGPVLQEIDDRYSERSRGKYNTSLSHKPFSPTIITTTITGEYCGAWGMVNHPILKFHQENLNEPVLLKPVNKWRRLTHEDYMAWQVETKLETGSIPRYPFEEYWAPRFPPEAGIIKRDEPVTSFRHSRGALRR